MLVMGFILLAALLFGLDAFAVKGKVVAWTPAAWMCLTLALAFHLGFLSQYV